MALSERGAVSLLRLRMRRSALIGIGSALLVLLPDRVALSPEALRSVSTSPLFARSSQRDDETGQEIGLVLAAGVTAAAVIVGLVLVGRHRAPGADV